MKAKKESDTMVEKNGVKLVVDPMSIQYLMGSEIDFKKIYKEHALSLRTLMQMQLVVADHLSHKKEFFRRIFDYS